MEMLVVVHLQVQVLMEPLVEVVVLVVLVLLIMLHPLLLKERVVLVELSLHLLLHCSQQCLLLGKMR